MRRGKLIVSGVVAALACVSLIGCGSSPTRSARPSRVQCMPGPVISHAGELAPGVMVPDCAHKEGAA